MFEQELEPELPASAPRGHIKRLLEVLEAPASQPYFKLLPVENFCFLGIVARSATRRTGPTTAPSACPSGTAGTRAK